MRHWKLLILAVTLSVLQAVCPLASAQSREETIDFLFRETVVNGVRFDFDDGTFKRTVHDYNITEDGCIVHITAVADESTTDWGTPPLEFTGRIISVSIDFNKLLLNRYYQDGNMIEIKVGDPGAVYGADWIWKNDNEIGFDHSNFHLIQNDFSEDHLA